MAGTPITFREDQPHARENVVPVGARPGRTRGNRHATVGGHAGRVAFKTLNEGDRVELEVVQGQKGPAAENVRKV